MWPPQALAALVAGHLNRYPQAQAQDVYKLLYQGILGPEHLVASPQAFAARLQDEYAQIAPNANELLWEPIRPDETLGRLNLRPFKAHGGDLSQLVGACLQTAQQPWGALPDLRAAWASFGALPLASQWSDQVCALTGWLEQHNWAALHHSEHYRQTYLPSYRLLAQKYLAGL